MPVYEYRCRECGRRSSFLVLSIENPPQLMCRHCGSNALEKLVSRIAILRSEEDRMEDLAESADLSGVDEKDPGSVARWMKKMGREMGDDLGEDFEESMDETMEKGSGAADKSEEDEGSESPSD